MQRSEITLKEVGIEMTNTVSSQPLSSYISHKLISKRPIRLSSISMPVDDHNGFLSSIPLSGCQAKSGRADLD